MRVKLEQARKAAMWMPIRRESGEGSTERAEPGAGGTRCPRKALVSFRWNGSSVSWACSGSGVCYVSRVRESAMKPVGKPDAGNRHVRFDERGWETERRSASVPAPNLDSRLPTDFFKASDVIDEAFGRRSDESARYGLELFARHIERREHRRVARNSRWPPHCALDGVQQRPDDTKKEPRS